MVPDNEIEIVSFPDKYHFIEHNREIIKLQEENDTIILPINGDKTPSLFTDYSLDFLQFVREDAPEITISAFSNKESARTEKCSILIELGLLLVKKIAIKTLVDTISKYLKDKLSQIGSTDNIGTAEKESIQKSTEVKFSLMYENEPEKKVILNYSGSVEGVEKVKEIINDLAKHD